MQGFEVGNQMLLDIDEIKLDPDSSVLSNPSAFNSEQQNIPMANENGGKANFPSGLKIADFAVDPDRSDMCSTIPYNDPDRCANISAPDQSANISENSE